MPAEQVSLKRLRYAALSQADIKPGLLNGFCRRQQVKLCWRKEDGVWLLRDVPFTEDWDRHDLANVLADLAAATASGGAVVAAFEGNVVVGLLRWKANRSAGSFNTCSYRTFMYPWNTEAAALARPCL